MSEPKKIVSIKPELDPTRDDSRMIVVMTKAELRNLIREELIATSPHEGTELLTPEELADKMKIPVSWVYEQSRLGNIPTHRIGRYIRFDLGEVLNCQTSKFAP